MMITDWETNFTDSEAKITDLKLMECALLSPSLIVSPSLAFSLPCVLSLLVLMASGLVTVPLLCAEDHAGCGARFLYFPRICRHFRMKFLGFGFLHAADFLYFRSDLSAFWDEFSGLLSTQSCISWMFRHFRMEFLGVGSLIVAYSLYSFRILRHFGMEFPGPESSPSATSVFMCLLCVCVRARVLSIGQSISTCHENEIVSAIFPGHFGNLGKHSSGSILVSRHAVIFTEINSPIFLQSVMFAWMSVLENFSECGAEDKRADEDRH